MTKATSAELARAVEWFCRSGIQESNGGVARYHLLGESRNLAVSTEITGYAVSALFWGYGQTGDRKALEAGLRAADFLALEAWQPGIAAMPFEVAEPLPPSYFFDCGIIVRGLLAAWRESGRAEYLRVAREIGLAMGRDFWSGRDLHPILELPSKKPRAYEKRWSKEPGCFLLKSAMAWANLAQLYPGEAFEWWYEKALARALETHLDFLPGTSDEIAVMDRLHAYCYFLEALQPRAWRGDVREALRIGIGRVEGYLRKIGPRFERSDVCGQLLRVRLLSDAGGAVPLDVAAAEYEAAHCESHQMAGESPMTSGGFCFGARDGAPMPYANPVSTAFCMQAMAWWRDWQAGEFQGRHEELI